MSDEIRQLPRLIDRPRFWQYIGYKPHEGQAQVHASAAPRRAMACGVRMGKTICAAMEGVVSALEPVDRSVGWVVAPNYELSARVLRELVHVFRTKFPQRIRQYAASERKLIVTNMQGGTCEIRGKSADNPVSLLGEGLDWLIVDEAARLKAEIWQKYLSQRLVDKRGWAMLISSPRGKGWFYDEWRAGQPQWKKPGHDSWNLPTWANPRVPRAWIEEQRSMIPDAVWRQEYGAEFIEGAGQVFRNVRERATGALAEPEKGKQYFAGLDLARVNDYTVMIVVDRERRVVAFDRYTRLDWTTQVGRIAALAEKYNRASVLVDSTGAGEPVYEKLREAGVRAEPYTFTSASKSALVNNLAMMLEQGKLTLPAPLVCPELVDEMDAFEFSVTESGNVKAEAPSGQHDDCVIGLALAAWAVRKDPVRMVARWT